MSETTTPAEPRTRRPVARRLLGNPLVWATVLLATAWGLTWGGDDLGFWSFLCMILGGWCVGVAVVSATDAMRPARIGLAVHAGVAVVLGLGMSVLVMHAGEVLSGLPTPVRAVLLVLQIAAAPAVCWIWLGLLARLIAPLGRRRAISTATAVAPEWARDPGGDGSGIEIRAIPIRMRVIAAAIVGVVLVLAAAGTALLIAVDDAVMRMGPRLAIIAIGVLVGLPAYLVLTAILRRRTITCAVTFGRDELRLRIGDEWRVIPYRDLRELVWRTRSDYARVEVRGGGVDVSLVVGLAKPSPGRTAELPELPRRVLRRLQQEGMVVDRPRRDGPVTLRRAGRDGERIR